MKEFFEIFKLLRKDKGLTQEQVAEILGTSPQNDQSMGNRNFNPGYYDVAQNCILF